MTLVPAADERIAAVRPGESVARLAALSLAAVERCGLDLHGKRVLTEAATGPYAVTPVLAALAGAEVVAVTRATPYGSIAQVIHETHGLAQLLGVWDRITVKTHRDPADFAQADLITNSGHLRPIVGELAEAIRPGAALALMFETWEIQAGRIDLDVKTIVGNGVRVAGTNERHPNVGVFDYLGLMAVVQLADAGIPALSSRISLLCDNPFRDYIADGLRRQGAVVTVVSSIEEVGSDACDALLVARTPTGGSVLSEDDISRFADRGRGAPIVQYWGDVDREACARYSISIWPVDAPGPGHMAVLPSRPGPDAIVRLQSGGLKVGQVLLTPASERTPADLEYLDGPL